MSKRFRKDKMDIYNRINKHILKLLAANEADNCFLECNRYIQNFVEYSRELFMSKLKYDEKKKLFFYKGESNSVLKYERKAGSLSSAQKMLLLYIKTKIFLSILYFLFKRKFL